ncbi:MAG: hypothetical protein ACREDR_39205, partial [Blastocatellia bacterium]
RFFQLISRLSPRKSPLYIIYWNDWGYEASGPQNKSQSEKAVVFCPFSKQTPSNGSRPINDESEPLPKPPDFMR